MNGNQQLPNKRNSQKIQQIYSMHLKMLSKNVNHTMQTACVKLSHALTFPLLHKLITDA